MVGLRTLQARVCIHRRTGSRHSPGARTPISAMMIGWICIARRAVQRAACAGFIRAINCMEIPMHARGWGCMRCMDCGVAHLFLAAFLLGSVVSLTPRNISGMPCKGGVGERAQPFTLRAQEDSSPRSCPWYRPRGVLPWYQSWPALVQTVGCPALV